MESTTEHSGIAQPGLNHKVWLTPAETVVLSGIGRTRLYSFLRSGELPSAKVGSRRYIRREDLDQFMLDHMGTF